MKKEQKTKKLFTIDQFNIGDWVCFNNTDNSKCIGIINELTIVNKDSNNMADYYASILVINFIDDMGISGTIKVDDFPTEKLITGVNMTTLFNNHNPIISSAKTIDFKSFLTDPLNLTNLN